jgi:hypothetical protein
MASQRFSTNLGLATFPEIDQSKYGSIFSDNLRIRQALQTLQAALDKYTGALGPDSAAWSSIDPASYALTSRIQRFYALASEDIAQGAMVNLYNNAGTINARNSNGSAAGKAVRAFANSAITSGSYGEFILGGVNPYISGMTPGTLYYMGNTNGTISATAGTVSQKVGYALTASKLFFQPELIA